ncbi:MAG: adenosylmethionine--8-amino-7-oxononanoate transaminase [Bacteroidota bacterium]
MNPIWPPFTHLKYAEEPINIISAKGSFYFDDEGNQYIDAISSWWVNIHGHSHPYIAQKISEQAVQNAHSIFSGFTHPQAQRLAGRITKILPGNLSKVFFSDDGSTSVEVAIKMAIQYFHNKNEYRTKIVAFENGYHGDTFGSMSAGARNVFSNAFNELLFDVIHIPVPDKYNLESILYFLNEKLANENVAAFIFEPIIQGAGGMVMYEPELLDILISKMKSYNVICIADEVMTGFGRTGKMFASDWLTQKPDIICLSKGLTGGFLPLGITACAEFIFEGFLSDDKRKTFFHGHSYTANPIACAAANASLDLFESENTLEKVKRINSEHTQFKKLNEVRLKNWSIRVCGTILALEYINEKREYLAEKGNEICRKLFLEKIIIRPLGNVVYLLPPYCITEVELKYIYSALVKIITTHDN